MSPPGERLEFCRFVIEQGVRRYGRYALLLLALSLLFFSVVHAVRSPAPVSWSALYRTIDESICVHALAESGEAAVEHAIDRSLRAGLLFEKEGSWLEAYWSWLWRWDRQRQEIGERVLWTVLLALFCLGITLALALWLGSFARQAENRWKGPGLRVLKAGYYALGAFPAYALIFLLADMLKWFQAGTWPLAIVGVLAIAVGDGIWVTTAEAVGEASRRLEQRDFMASVRERLAPGAAKRYLRRLVLIDLLPHYMGRLTVIIGSIVVVGIVPGLYRGTLGGQLNIHDPEVWLPHSLDALWGLALVVVGLTLLVDRAVARLQRDRKGIDRLTQIWGPAQSIELQWVRGLGVGILVLIGTLVVSGLHWGAGMGEVVSRLLLSLAEILLGGCMGLLLAVGVGVLLPLYWAAASRLILQFFEAIPRVIGVAFLMTAFNLGWPDAGAVTRVLVWCLLLGLFCFAEMGRSLHHQIEFLQKVDFVGGLRSLGFSPWCIFQLHIWPQIKYRIFSGIHPLVRAILFCEGAIAILRFAMKGMVIGLFSIGSLLAEGVEHFPFDQWRGALYGLATVGLMAACVEMGRLLMQWGWYGLFLRRDEREHGPAFGNDPVPG
jgi:ABC-type dipeptide/oligopeptide/nickel transport system permease component